MLTASSSAVSENLPQALRDLDIATVTFSTESLNNTLGLLDSEIGLAMK